MQFAVGMYCLLCRSVLVVVWVHSTLGSAFEEKQDTWKWQWKEERETDEQWTDNKQLQTYTPLIVGLQGVEGCFDLKPPNMEDQLLRQLAQSAK